MTKRKPLERPSCRRGEHALRFIAMIPGNPPRPDMERGRFCEDCDYRDRSRIVSAFGTPRYDAMVRDAR